MNSEDPRNRLYFERKKLLTPEDFRDNLRAIQVYPLQVSNYGFHANVDEGRHYSSPSTDASIETSGLQPKKLCYAEEPKDLEAEIRRLRDQGWAIKINGKHKLTKSENGFELVPEWELNEGVRRIFSIGREDGRGLDYSERGGEMGRLERLERYGPTTIEFPHTYVHAFCEEYLGAQRTEGVLTRLGRRIEQEMGLESQSLFQYTQHLARAALPQAPVLLIGDGKD